VALVLFAQLPVHGSYFADLFPAFMISGLGLALAFVPMSIGALTGVTESDAGIASGLINTTQQIGGALGVAVLTTVSTTRTENLLADGTPQPVAFTDGFSLAFWVAAAVAGISLLATLLLLRRADLQTAPAGAVVG
jgi:hypothetical protein